MSIRVSPGQGGSTRSVSGSASIEAQIAELRQKKNDLANQVKDLKANGGDRAKIAALERRIKQIEERIERLEKQKVEATKGQQKQQEESVRYKTGFDETI